MKECPILFSTPMVQAIIEGRKNMTRRIVKPQPIDNTEIDGNFFYGNKGYVKVDGHPNWKEQFVSEFSRFQPGDILWVRESFRVNSWYPDDGELDFRYEADGKVSELVAFDSDDDGEIFNRYWIQSCDDLIKSGYESTAERFEDYDVKKLRLRPGIFMLKDIARIWLEVTNVKVEMVCDITEEDAKMEGVFHMIDKDGNYNVYWDYIKRSPLKGLLTAKESFMSLWESINGEESWNKNIFVLAISFKVLSTNGKPLLPDQNHQQQDC